DAGLVVEDRLGAVPVVHVHVDVRDPAGPVVEQPPDGDGRVVVHAEAAGPLGHGVVRPAGRVERVLGPSAPDGFGGDDRRPGHARPGLVHVREDRVVAGAVPELPPGTVLTVPGARRRVHVSLGVDGEEFVHRGVAGGRLHNTVPVDDPVVLDQLAREQHALRTERMLRAVVVHRSVVSVPHELHAIAHRTGSRERRASVNAGRLSRSWSSNTGNAIMAIAYRKAGAAAATPVSLAKYATTAVRISVIVASRHRGARSRLLPIGPGPHRTSASTMGSPTMGM